LTDLLAGLGRELHGLFRERIYTAAGFSSRLVQAMAANPFIEFYLRATESGRLEFVWEEDGGGVYVLEHQLTVA